MVRRASLWRNFRRRLELPVAEGELIPSLNHDSAMLLARESIDRLARRAGYEFEGPRRTKGNFIEAFVIEPRRREYYVSVTCTGARPVAGKRL